MTTIYLRLTLVGNGPQTNLSRTSTSMNCKWPTWPCKNEKQAITRERKRKRLAKSASWKPWELSEDLADKVNLSHTRLTLVLECMVTHGHTDTRTDSHTHTNWLRAQARQTLMNKSVAQVH